MFAKKTLCMLSAGTMLAAAAPAFADRGDDYRWRGRAVAERPVFVERQAVQGPSRAGGVYDQLTFENGWWGRTVPGTSESQEYFQPLYRASGADSRPVYAEQPVSYRGHRQPVYAPAPVYSEPAYYPAAPVYSEPAYYPEPVYRQDHTAIGAIGGAILGAIIGNQVGHGNGKGAALGAGAGAVIGGILGSAH